MHAVTRLQRRNTQTACHYAHLQVRVWNTCKLHEISRLQLIKYVYWDYWIYIYP